MVPVDGTAQPVSGHIFRRNGKRGLAWYAKYRLPDGRQVKKRIGPHWSERGTAPPPGYFTKSTAQAWLDSTLAKARLGEFGGIASTRETVADAVNEWLGYVELDRQRKPSTLVDYRHMANRIKADLGKRRTDRVTAELIEDYRDELVRQGLSNRTVNKYLVVLHGIFARAKRRLSLPANPAAAVERRPSRKRANIEVFSRDEVMALVRCATNEQDGAIFLTAAFTGLRLGELLALRWRDVDFERQSIHVRRALSAGVLDTPKSGVERAVPMADEVAETLAKLSLREEFTAPDDLVFRGRVGHLHPGRLRERYKKALKRAGLRALRFHDLRHTFGTHAIQAADAREVMEWMGHADIRTTQLYLQFKSRSDAARRISLAFRAEGEADENPNGPAPVAPSPTALARRAGS